MDRFFTFSSNFCGKVVVYMRNDVADKTAREEEEEEGNKSEDVKIGSTQTDRRPTDGSAPRRDADQKI